MSLPRIILSCSGLFGLVLLPIGCSQPSDDSSTASNRTVGAPSAEKLCLQAKNDVIFAEKKVKQVESDIAGLGDESKKEEQIKACVKNRKDNLVGTNITPDEDEEVCTRVVTTELANKEKTWLAENFKRLDLVRDLETKRDKLCADAKVKDYAAASKPLTSFPTKGCYIFTGTRAVTSQGADIIFGDGVTSMPIIIEKAKVSISNPKEGEILVRPKSGSQKCAQFEMFVAAHELRLPTAAERSLCLEQCSASPAPIATPIPTPMASATPAPVVTAASPSPEPGKRGCYTTYTDTLLYKTQFKAELMKPDVASVKDDPGARYAIGGGMIFYVHNTAGNMLYVTVKTGTFKGSEGWIDETDAFPEANLGHGLVKYATACPTASPVP